MRFTRNMEIVLETLSDLGPVPSTALATEVARRTGRRVGRVLDTLHRMEDAGILVRSGNGCHLEPGAGSATTEPVSTKVKCRNCGAHSDHWHDHCWSCGSGLR